MSRPNLRVTSVTIGSSQPRELARFYADLLGWPVTASDPPRPGMPEQAGWAQIKPPPEGTGPTLNFEYERRSEERRVGKEWRSRWSPETDKKQQSRRRRPENARTR